MSPTATSTTTSPSGPRSAEPRPRGLLPRALHGPGAVLVGCLVAAACFVVDAVAGEARLGLVGLAVMALALALTLTQAVWARVGRPWRTSRRAAVVGTAASLFVAAFLSSVGILERMGPQVTGSAAFAAGVAVMSVTLLVVLPLVLVVFACGVAQDRRLGWWMRVLPWVWVLVVGVSAVIVAMTEGSRDLWLHAAAVAIGGALLTGLSAGLSRAGVP